MHRRLSLAALMLLGLLTFALGAHAEPLKNAQIDGFINSLAELQALGEKYEGTQEWTMNNGAGSMGNSGAGNWMADSISTMKGHEIYREFETIVASHGFSSPEQWGQVGDRILKAVMALSMGQHASGMEQQMEEALRELENNPNLTPEQKQMMKRSMTSGLSQMKSLSDAPPADIEAVRPHMEKLEQAFNAADGDH